MTHLALCSFGIYIYLLTRISMCASWVCEWLCPCESYCQPILVLLPFPDVRGFPVLRRLALTLCVWWFVGQNEPCFQSACCFEAERSCSFHPEVSI